MSNDLDYLQDEVSRLSDKVGDLQSVIDHLMAWVETHLDADGKDPGVHEIFRYERDRLWS